jgi:hypothetical protein
MSRFSGSPMTDRADYSGAQRRVERSDYGTSDARHHNTIEPELTGHGHAVRMRVRDGTELDRLHRAGLIDADQHAAGCALARDLHGARMLGLKTTAYDRQGGAGAGGLSDGQATALERVGDAVRYMDGAAGAEARTLTVNVCLGTVRLDQPAAILAARCGLDALLAFGDRRHSPVGTRIMHGDDILL